MKSLKTLIALTAMFALPALGWADELYRLTFSGTARFLNESDDVKASRLTAKHLVARCVGTNDLSTNYPFLLVYNATRDRIQVVNETNGSIMCDVLEFQNRFSNANDRRLERLAFVFVPDDTNAAGSAIIYEKLNHPGGRISLSGRAQFVLSSIEPDSANSRFDDSGSTNSGSAVSLSTASSLTTAASVMSSPTVSASPSGVTDNTVAAPPSPGTLPGTTGLPPSPGTLLSTTNSPGVVTTNALGVPGTPASPGTLLNTTNSPGVVTTNALGVPVLPPSPGTLLDVTNSIGSTTNVGTTNITGVVTPPGTTNVITPGSSNVTGVVTTPSTNVTVVVTTPGTTNVTGVITTPGTTNVTGVVTTPGIGTVTNVVDGTVEQITNVVICSGNFSAGRRVRVPDQ